MIEVLQCQICENQEKNKPLHCRRGFIILTKNVLSLTFKPQINNLILAFTFKCTIFNNYRKQIYLVEVTLKI